MATRTDIANIEVGQIVIILPLLEICRDMATANITTANSILNAGIFVNSGIDIPGRAIDIRSVAPGSICFIFVIDKLLQDRIHITVFTKLTVFTSHLDTTNEHTPMP